MKPSIVVVIAVYFLCSATEVFSQVNYLPGYVVSLEGDTLRGFVDYRNWERNPESISFRRSESDPETSYKPLDIRSFFVSGDRYEGAIVDVETSPTRLADLDDNPDLHIKKDTAFLQILVGGEKSLYLLYESDLKYQIYIRQRDQFELLIFKTYTREVKAHAWDDTGKKMITTNKKYINQLALYLNDCATIQKKMKNLRYQGKSIARLFDTYYKCTQGKATFEVVKEKYLFEVGAIAGVTQSSIKFGSTNASAVPDLIRPTFSKGTNFTGGLFFDLIRPRNHRKWSLNNELIYTSYNTEATYYSRYVDETNYQYTYTRLEYSYLKLNTMLRFKYPVGRFYVFLDAGISNGYMLSGTDYQQVVNKSVGLDRGYDGHAFPSGTYNYEQGFFGGLGLRYQRYSFETRYEKTSGMLNYAGLWANLNKLSFLLTYRFTH